MAALLLAGSVAASCGPLPRHGLVSAMVTPPSAMAKQAGLVAKAPEKPARVTDRKANTEGKILILEYHKLSGHNSLLD